MSTASRLAIVAVFVLSAPLTAQATRLVDPLDPAYRDLRQLVDDGLIDRLSLAQRPLSRAAIRKAVDEAATRLRAREGVAGPVLAGAPRDASTRRLPFDRELIASIRERLGLPDSATEPLPPTISPLRALT